MTMPPVASESWRVCTTDGRSTDMIRSWWVRRRIETLQANRPSGVTAPPTRKPPTATTGPGRRSTPPLGPNGAGAAHEGPPHARLERPGRVAAERVGVARVRGVERVGRGVGRRGAQRELAVVGVLGLVDAAQPRLVDLRAGQRVVADAIARDRAGLDRRAVDAAH